MKLSDKANYYFFIIFLLFFIFFLERNTSDQKGVSSDLELKIFNKLNSHNEDMMDILVEADPTASSVHSTTALTVSAGVAVNTHTDTAHLEKNKKKKQIIQTGFFYFLLSQANFARKEWKLFDELRKRVKLNPSAWDSEECKQRAEVIVSAIERGNTACLLHFLDLGVRLPPMWNVDIIPVFSADQVVIDINLKLSLLYMSGPACKWRHGTHEDDEYLHRRGLITFAPKWSPMDEGSSSRDGSMLIEEVGTARSRANKIVLPNKMTKTQVEAEYENTLAVRRPSRIVSVWIEYKKEWILGTIATVDRAQKCCRIHWYDNSKVDTFSDVHFDDILAPSYDWKSRTK